MREYVRGLAGVTALVIANINVDHCRIPRIIFLKTTLNFAYEIGADVGRFCVNTTAESCKHADETPAQREPYQAAYCRITSDHLRRDGVKDRHRQQRKSHHEQTGYRATVESHAQCIEPRDTRGLRCADICQYGDTHPDKTSRERTERPNYEPDRGGRFFKNQKQHEYDHRDYADRLHLPI